MSGDTYSDPGEAVEGDRIQFRPRGGRGVAVVLLPQAACFGEALRSSMRLFTDPVRPVKRWDLWCAHQRHHPANVKRADGQQHKDHRHHQTAQLDDDSVLLRRHVLAEGLFQSVKPAVN